MDKAAPTGKEAGDVEVDTTSAAAKLGRLGGLARKEKLTAEQRKEIARKGGLARKKKDKP